VLIFEEEVFEEEDGKEELDEASTLALSEAVSSLDSHAPRSVVRNCGFSTRL